MPGPDPRCVVPPVARPHVPARSCGKSAPRGRPSGCLVSTLPPKKMANESPVGRYYRR